MSHEQLVKAVEVLSIREIILAEANVRLDPALNTHEPNLQLRAKMLEGNQVACEQVSGKTQEGNDCRFIRLGFRFTLQLLGPTVSTEPANTAPEAAAKEDVKVTIEALLKGVYAVNGDDFPGQDVIQAFVANAKFHVWPYWREFVTQMVARMNLPTVTIPPYQIHHPSEDAK